VQQWPASQVVNVRARSVHTWCGWIVLGPRLTESDGAREDPFVHVGNRTCGCGCGSALEVKRVASLLVMSLLAKEQETKLTACSTEPWWLRRE
jgi:hypothetical protein